MQAYIYHLQARSPFHFGVRGVGIEETADHAESDTLFSALCHIARLTSGEAGLKTLLKRCQAGDPPFLLGGAYPYVPSKAGVIRFYPAPITLTMHRTKDNPDLYKAAWLSESLFMALTGGKITPADFERQAMWLESIDAAVTPAESTALTEQYGRAAEVWKSADVPRVTVDRITNASAVYQSGRLTFVEGGGLWTMIAYRRAAGEWDDQRLRGLLLELGDSGIGGERSAGNGQFALGQAVSTHIDPLKAGQKFVSLSLVYPRKSEIAALNGGAYNLITRRGWISSPESSSRRRKSVRMLAAGSVLTAQSATDAFGGMADVKPDPDPKLGVFPHDVWRWGFALPIPTV